MSQCSMIKHYISKHGSIDGKRAYELCGTLCLPRRIKDIESDGKGEYIRSPKHANGKHWVEYQTQWFSLTNNRR